MARNNSIDRNRIEVMTDKKARTGEIPNFTGIGSPYEPPKTPDLTLHTDNPEFTDMMTLLLAKL